MKIAKHLLLLLSFALIALVQAFPSFSQSQELSIQITEFMYDLEGSDSGYEWVEILNVSETASVTIVGGNISGSWRFRDGSNHLLEAEAYQGDMTLVPGEYAVLVQDPTKFTNQYRGYTGAVIKVGAMSLKNDTDDSGAEVGLRIGSSGSIWSLLRYYRGWGGNGNGKTLAKLNARGDNNVSNWKEANPTPGAKNSFPKEGTKDQQQTQPTINFSASSSVAVGTQFSVSVTLKNFKSGTYALKVLIGKGGKFIYGNTKGASGWLTQNGKWAEMPRITISSSGNKTIQAKTDDDAVAGKYLIKVRAHRDSDNFESGTKSLAVTGTAESGSVSGEGSASKSIDEEGAEPALAGVAEGEGEVLGEASSKEGFKLSFYIILGIFGMLVGSGGLILAFRRRSQRSQTPDTPEPERDLP